MGDPSGAEGELASQTPGTLSPSMKITDAMISEVEELVQLGVPPLAAVMAQGASSKEFAEWWTQGSDGGTSRPAKLYQAIKKAEARCQAILVGKVRQAATTEASHAEWLLERRFPDVYVRKSVQERKDDSATEPQVDVFASVDNIDNVTPLRK